MSSQRRSSAPMLDVQQAVRYRLRQSFCYDYDRPVHDLVHRLVVVPPTRHGDQRLLLGAVQVSDPAASLVWTTDVDGNRHCTVRLARVAASVAMTVDVSVERSGDAPLLDARLLADPRLRSASALTRPDRAVRALAAQVRGLVALDAAEQVCERVHDLIDYSFGATTVATTAAQALAVGAGVCQDQAHVMLAVLRAAGVACRYVSGHLVGQGGTHAWVEVLAPEGGGARAVAFDPCHARRADRRYVTVAVGRDYRDVPPTSGWFTGPGRGTLSCQRRLSCDAPVPAMRETVD